MSNHTSVLVPLETWCYMSPRLKHSGKLIDIGLFAESLIYYDRVFVALPYGSAAFTGFVSWFVKQDKYKDLIALLKDGVINFYYYSFRSAAIRKVGESEYSIMNVQDEDAAQFSMFDKDCLTTSNLRQILPHANQRAKLYRAIRGKVIEAKAKNFGPAIDNARRDYHDPKRCELLIQSLLDEVYPILNLKYPPIVKSQVNKSQGKVNISWNIDFDRLDRELGMNLRFFREAPLNAAAQCNRFLWSAAEQDCDLYLHSPMSTLVGDKLYESGERLKRTQETVEQLVTEVEFPNIRQLVNDGQIGLETVLEIRRKGHRFRKWLQDESERDRNALFAYHREVAQESGWTKGSRKVLALFGVLGGAVATAAIDDAVAGALGAVAGTVVGSYVDELASKLRGRGWSPIIFGDWASDRIRKELSGD